MCTKLADKDLCTGCMACVNACPKKCINIEQDSMGNLFPVIDYSKCVECKKCEKSCPINNNISTNFPNKAYAVWSLDQQDRKTSTSGGAASVFYQQAISDNMYICGVEYDNDFHVKHTISRDIESIQKFKRSKYVYSEVDNIYELVKEKLNTGENVLFISLPCKVAGLRGFLNKDYDNLTTIDIVCHGTPSYKMLYDHIKFVDKKGLGTKLRFRDDNQKLFYLSSKNKIIYRKHGEEDTYMAAFSEGLACRESCYHCQFAKSKRISDITISDFWGLGSEIPFEHEYSGAISAVLINTPKGMDFFEKSKHRFFYEERPVEEAIKGNAQLNSPTKHHLKRNLFEEMYKSVGFEKAVKKCLHKEMFNSRIKRRKASMRMKIRKLASLFIKKYRR